MGYRRTNYKQRDEYFTPRYAIEPLLPYLVGGGNDLLSIRHEGKQLCKGIYGKRV